MFEIGIPLHVMLGYIRFILKHDINISHLLLLYTHILLTRYQLTLSPIWKIYELPCLRLHRLVKRIIPLRKKTETSSFKECFVLRMIDIGQILFVNVINVLTIISLCNRREHLRSVYTGHWVYFCL